MEIKWGQTPFNPVTSDAASPADWTDATGRHHARASQDARIACLVPSITELVCDLGLGSQLVARTGFCIHPQAVVADIPKVGGTKDVNLRRLRELAPTHAIVNIDENNKPVVDEIARFVPHVIVTHPNAPADNLALYRLIGGIFDREDAAQKLCNALESALGATLEASTALPRERVLYLIWKDPWMTVARDTYISRTLAAAGWDTVEVNDAQANDTGTTDIVTTGAARYPQLALDAAAHDADLILLSTEPFMFRAADVAELARRFPAQRVMLIDGEMTSWYGSRAIAGLAYLRKLRLATQVPGAAPASAPTPVTNPQLKKRRVR
jgi:ABC-type Fe3+-hydroxamate transport system substrate-binding protein